MSDKKFYVNPNEFDRLIGTICKYKGNKLKIEIPEGITCIGSYAFRRRKVKSIRIPQSLRYIESHAFEDCVNLKEIIIPKNVELIDDFAFWGCTKLEKVIFENPDIIKIGIRAFEGTKFQEKIIKEKGEFIIGSFLVKVPSNVKKYIVPDGITSICGCAFNKSELSELVIPEGVTYIGKYAFADSKLKNISLPESLREISDCAFMDCELLEELTIPEGVEIIYSSAFNNIPKCVLTILNKSEEAFLKDSGLDSFMSVSAFGSGTANVKKVRAYYGTKAMRCARKMGLPFESLGGTPEMFKYIEEDFCCDGTVLIEYLGHEKTVRIPDGITEINEYAFYNDYNKTEHLILPDSLEKIGVGAFMHCTSLKSIEEKGVKSIDESAFYWAYNLERVSFPSLESCSASCFSDCDSLLEENINIPEYATIFDS